jgi:ketosteroid isomerase-like protein
MADGIEIVRRYVAAVEAGATGDALAAFYTPDAVQEELPNRLVPAGARYDLPAILRNAERGQTVVAGQRFEILSLMSEGDRVAAEIAWSATLKVPVATLAAGAVIKARYAMFFGFRDGRIAWQRNYDCFEPF